MNMSDKKKSELYGAIHEEIIKARIVSAGNILNPSDIDSMLAQLDISIWVEVRKALNITDQ